MRERKLHRAGGGLIDACSRTSVDNQLLDHLIAIYATEGLQEMARELKPLPQPKQSARQPEPITSAYGGSRLLRVSPFLDGPADLPNVSRC